MAFSEHSEPDDLKTGDSKTNSSLAFLNNKVKLSTVLSVLLIISLISLFFKDTIFDHKPISKTYAAKSIDSFINNDPQKARIFCTIDPSIWMTQLPAYSFSDAVLRTHKLPLWNPHVGAGYPHMATVENAVFHPIRFILPSTNEYTYNLSIVLKIALSALGMFGLIRALGLPNLPALFGSFIYALCPYLLEVTELSYEAWCYPLLMWLFVFSMHRRTFWSAAGLGAGCAIAVVNLHPGCSINAVSTSLLIGWLSCIFERDGDRKSFRAYNFEITKHLALAGLIGFCMASPILLQYIEFFSNAWSYKLEYQGSNGVPWQPLVYMLANPGIGGSSLFLGIIAAILLPLPIVSPTPKSLPVIIGAAVLFMVCTAMGPFEFFFKIKPFTYLHPYYFLPLYLLLFSILAALGVQVVSSPALRKFNRYWLTMLLSSSIALSIPGLFKFCGFSFVGYRWAGTTPDFDVNVNAWHRDIVIVIILFFILYLGHKFFSNRMNWLGPTTCIVLGLTSMLSVSRHSLPTHPSFFFPKTSTIGQLKKPGYRFIATGRHFLDPNLSSLFHLDDFRFFNSLFLDRYVKYIQFCGAKRHFLSYDYDSSLTKGIDAASVKYILSRNPIFDGSVKVSDPKLIDSAQINLTYPGMKLIKASFEFDIDNSQIIGQANWQIAPESLNSYGWQAILLSEHGVPLWTGPENQFIFDEKINDRIITRLCYAVPRSIPKDSTVLCGLKITNTFGTPIEPSDKPDKNYGSIVVLKNFDTQKDQNQNTLKEQHCKLVYETDSNTRIYENNNAFPSAYTIHSVKAADSAPKALELLKQINLKENVILEVGGDNQEEIKSGSIGSGRIRPVYKLERPDCNTVRIQVKMNTPGILVLTDSYYPGWKAYLDGVETPVYPANYLFRAIKVPDGNHSVEYRYLPASFLAGLALTGLCTACLIFRFIFEIKAFLLNRIEKNRNK